jgi:hypothetical protein
VDRWSLIGRGWGLGFVEEGGFGLGGLMGWIGDVGLLVQSGLGTGEEERENQMEERESLWRRECV